MSASRRFPTARFQSGIAAIYACTGALPSPFGICGLPPASRTTFSLFRALLDLAAGAGLALARGLGAALLVAGGRDLPARDFTAGPTVSWPGRSGPPRPSPAP